MSFGIAAKTGPHFLRNGGARDRCLRQKGGTRRSCDISRYKSIQGELEKANQQLRERITELERFDKVAIGREKRILELKAEVAALKAEIGQIKGKYETG